MIHTDDGETFIIEFRQGTIEISKDELEHLIAEGEILLDDLGMLDYDTADDPRTRH